MDYLTLGFIVVALVVSALTIKLLSYRSRVRIAEQGYDAIYKELKKYRPDLP